MDTDDKDDNNDQDPDDNPRHDNANKADLRQLQQANKGKKGRYANYTLLLNARCLARGGPRIATIKDGFMFFSDDDLRDAKPIPVEDRLEFAFGVILQQYSIGKKFQERGKKGVKRN